MASYACAIAADLGQSLPWAILSIRAILRRSRLPLASGSRHPPQACAVLAGFTYTAAFKSGAAADCGTILGALWADKLVGPILGLGAERSLGTDLVLVYSNDFSCTLCRFGRDFRHGVGGRVRFSASVHLVRCNFFWAACTRSGAGAGDNGRVIRP